jgi:hypothetical protein
MEQIIPHSSAASYTQDEKELRDKFVIEYLRDYNSYAAAVRCGFCSEEAVDSAKLFMEEPYVRRSIADAETRREAGSCKDDDLSYLPDGFVPHDAESDKQRIKSGLFREAFYKGPGASHSSRVSAFCKLADIYGINKQEVKKESRSTNVMIVPAMGSVDAWENSAKQQQSELKRTVTE